MLAYPLCGLFKCIVLCQSFVQGFLIIAGHVALQLPPLKELQKLMRVQSLRCHALYNHSASRLSVIPIHASRSQAIRFVSVFFLLMHLLRPCYVGCWDREERVDRETAAAALQYPRRYSTAGTVHRLGVGGQRLGLGARERGQPRGFAHGRQERRDFLLISCFILD